MYIVHLSAELAPVAKVGGLGDVLHGLSRELVRQGHQVELILPRHASLPESILTPLDQELLCPFGGSAIQTRVWHAEVDGLSAYFIEPLERDLFPRSQIYGYPDDIERYTYFSRAALEFLKATGRRPDILHLHEWQTALAAPLYRDLFQGEAAIALTIHNLAYQGQCSPYDLDRVGLSGHDYLTPERLQDDETSTLVNLMKGGIVYADRVNTVSPTYAQELLHRVHHHGLESTLIRLQEKFCGILNGIDTDTWNPKKDRFLFANYSASDLSGKAENKRKVQEALGLTVCDRPLISVVSRLDMQKGIPLIQHALRQTVGLGGQFIILGAPSTARIEEEFTQLREELRENPNVAIKLGHSEELAHQIFAASDFIFAPSLFEPCGLIQMIAMQYGAIPIVRKTGGLADTVEENRTGYLFEKPDNKEVNLVLDRAVATYQNDRKRSVEIALHGMEQDQSWKGPAAHYVELYRAIAPSHP